MKYKQILKVIHTSHVYIKTTCNTLMCNYIRVVLCKHGIIYYVNYRKGYLTYYVLGTVMHILHRYYILLLLGFYV